MNVVLIISDTFRRDHLGCYGNPWIHTPHLDRLAERSIVFDRYYAALLPTIPNRADVLSGKYSFAHGGWGPLPQNEKTLPQPLDGAGYTTMGIADTPFHDSVVTSWPLHSPGQQIRVVDDLLRRIVEPLPSTITDDEWTLLYAIEGEPVELYHAASDPLEESNVFEENETIGRDLHARFVGFLEQIITEERLIAPRRRLN